MSVVYRDVLERFVKYREQRNISQNELAQMLCISQSYVSKMEVGNAPGGALQAVKRLEQNGKRCKAIYQVRRGFKYEE